MNERILIIDDELVVRSTMKAALVHQGYIVAVADGGAEGIRLALEIKPDVILCDVMMPDVSGEEVIAKLKEEGLRTRFIYCTGISKTVKDAVRLTKLGACDMLVKPFTSEEVLNAVKRALAIESTIITNVTHPAQLIADVLKEAESLTRERKSVQRMESSLRIRSVIIRLVYLAVSVGCALLVKAYGVLSGWSAAVFGIIVFVLLSLPLGRTSKFAAQFSRSKAEAEFDRD